MKTIAFHLQKGGVGKTTLSGTIAYELSLKGKTLLIDCDPQGDASSWFLSEAQYDLSDVLTGKVSVDNAIITIAENFHILPTFGIDGDLKLYGETKLNDEPFVFCDLFEEIEKLGYEYVIVDLSPGMGRLEKAILTACDKVITPMTPEHFSLNGITIFSSELVKIKKTMRRAAKHIAVVINAFDARIKQHCEISEAASVFNFPFITIPVDPVFRKSQREKKFPQIFGGIKPETSIAIKTIGGLICH